MARHAKFLVVKTGKGWRVNIPKSISETGERQQLFFQTREKATEFAKTHRESKKEYGEQARTLGPGVAEDAIAALALLSSFEISLKDCARFYVNHHDLRAKAPTLGVAWKRAVSARSALSQRYSSTLKSWQRRLPAALLDCNIVDLTPAEISDALTKITNGATAWKSGLRVISAVLGDEVKQGSLKENPCKRVAAPKVKNDDEVTIYSVSQVRALFAACTQYDTGKDRHCDGCAVPFAFLAFAGIRPTELTRLTWDDVNMTLNNIRVKSAAAKTNRTRNVRINPTLKAWIETIPEDSREGKIVPGRWRFKATRVKKEAGLDGRALQDALRHSFASYSLATESEHSLLKADMGHQNWDVFFVHYHNAITRAEAAPYWEIIPSHTNNH